MQEGDKPYKWPSRDALSTGQEHELTAAEHPLAHEVFSRLHESPDGLVLPDDAVQPIVAAFATYFDEADRLIPAVECLLEVAHFLDVERKATDVAITLLALAFAAQDQLAAFGGKAAQAAQERLARAAQKFDRFLGDAGTKGVLGSGQRPAGTTAAGPMARFLVDKPKAPK